MMINRELKFRVWNKETNKMCDYLTLQQELYNQLQDGYLRRELNIEVEDYFEEEDCAKEYDHLIFMQYTGVKDKYNKEVYEGDLVKYWFTEEHSFHTVYEMVFENGAWLLKHENHYELLHSVLYNNWKLEIVGNIFEVK